MLEYETKTERRYWLPTRNQVWGIIRLITNLEGLSASRPEISAVAVRHITMEHHL